MNTNNNSQEQQSSKPPTNEEKKKEERSEDGNDADVDAAMSSNTKPFPPLVEPASFTRKSFDAGKMRLTELADHLVQVDHLSERGALGRIDWLIDNIVRTDGEKHAWSKPFQQDFRRLHHKLLEHMTREELVLFPIVRQLEEGTAAPAPLWATLEASLASLDEDHAGFEEAMLELRRLAGNYEQGEEDDMVRALFFAMEELERNQSMHIETESSQFFARVRERGRGQH